MQWKIGILRSKPYHAIRRHNTVVKTFEVNLENNLKNGYSFNKILKFGIDIFFNIQIISFNTFAQRHYEYMILTRSLLHVHRAKTINGNTGLSCTYLK